MRTIKLLATVALIAVTTIMFTSCSKENQVEQDNQIEEEKHIEGKWKITKASSTDDDSFSYARGETWIFKENGKCSIYVMLDEEYEEDHDGIWTLIDDKLTIELEPKTYTGTERDHDGNYISYTQEMSATGTFDIEKLNKDKLVISGSWKYSVKEDNETETYKYKVDYEFEAK